MGVHMVGVVKRGAYEKVYGRWPWTESTDEQINFIIPVQASLRLLMAYVEASDVVHRSPENPFLLIY